MTEQLRRGPPGTARRWCFFFLVLGLVIYVANRLEFGTNVTQFMPDESASDLAQLAGELTDSELTRTWVLSVSAEAPAQARAVIRELRDVLQADPAVAWVRIGSQPQDETEIFDLYYPRRLLFLSSDPEAEIPGMVSGAGLAQRARDMRLALAQPGSEFMDTWLVSDPLGAFQAILTRLGALNPGLRREEGQFMSRGGQAALLFFSTRASAFDSGVHAPLVDRLDAAVSRIRGRGVPGLAMEQSSAHRFAVQAEREMRGDILRVGLFSFVGVALLFLGLVGALRSFAIVILPPLFGILGALALSLFFFGSVDGLTMVFGISLMGVAIDYSIHLLVHHQFDGAGRGAWRTRDLLRLSLVMGAVTTMASFAGLGLTPFPAFREMAFFAITGLACAVGVTLWLLPEILPYAPRVPRRSQALASWLEKRVELLQRNRTWLWIPIAVVVLALPSLSFLRWGDDLSELSNLDPDWMAEDQRVRESASSMDGGRFVIAVAEDRAAAMALNDRVARRLGRAVDEGHLAGFSSLHHVLWSEDLQQRNWDVLASQAGLDARLETAFVGAGFSPGLFGEFTASLADEPPEFLTFEDLEATSLGGVMQRYEFPVGERTAVVSYLQGVHSPAGVKGVLEGLEGVRLFDQALFMNAIYREFRETTLQQMMIGGVLVVVILLVRYRSLKRAFAACLPALLVAPALLEIFVLLGVTANLLHVLSLILVLGMGVDYGIFLLDASERREGTGPTLLGLGLACLTTIFVFGALVISSHPALYAVGLTTGLGMILALLFSPVTLLFSSPAEESGPEG